MLRKDFEEEKKKRKRKAGIVLLVMVIVLLVGFVFGFCRWKNHENKTVDATEEVTEEAGATQMPEKLFDETENLKSETEEAEERPTTTLWEDNGPDERDVPEDVDAAYQQEAAEIIQTTEEQGGTE